MRVRVSGVEYESEKGISEVAIDNDYLPKIYMPARVSERAKAREREKMAQGGREGRDGARMMCLRCQGNGEEEGEMGRS